MYLSGKGNLVSQRTVQSRKEPSRFFHFVKVIDRSNNELEMIVDQPVNLEQFSSVEFVVDVIQGKYPQYKLLQIDCC